MKVFPAIKTELNFGEGFIVWADKTSIPLERPFEFKDVGMLMFCFQLVEEKNDKAYFTMYCLTFEKKLVYPPIYNILIK